MWDKFSIRVGTRQLRYGIAQTLLTIGVVGISVTLIIFLGSLIGGLQVRLIENTTGSIPHIVISQPDRYPIATWQLPTARDENTLYVGRRRRAEQTKLTIEDWRIWVERMEEFDPNIRAVSPVASGQALLSRGADQQGVTVQGVIPERHDPVVDITSRLVRGRFEGLAPSEVAIGYGLAQDFDLDLGDKVRLSTSEGESATLTVGGIFDVGVEAVDTNTVFVPLKEAQSLFGLGSAVTSIDLKLGRIFEANALAARLRKQVPYEIESWMTENQQLLTALRAQSTSATLILTFTTIAAGFAIASILITSVTSKLREIGILRAIGATRRQILSIFTFQSTLVSTLGGLIGAPAGVGMSLLLLRFRTVASASGREQSLFPIEVRWQLVVGSIAIAVVIGFLASLYPAWRAAKVNPIEVIRGQ